MLARILFHIFVVGTVTHYSNAEGQIWAVLVASSSGYNNYRHQADVCHSYQIFHRHGIPDSNIIVMMYDDIAYNKKNPLPGVIRNSVNGPNVYKGVPKDYTGRLVSAKNFLSILTGQKEYMSGIGSGKVLESGPNDHVFVYLVDHGGHGIICFPKHWLHAADLIEALRTMHRRRMYKKLAFYIDACHSGSMFENLLPDDIDVYAVTSTTPEEAAYACCHDREVDAAVGEEFSVAWMENIDNGDKYSKPFSETMLDQFMAVKKRVKHSHVSVYGDLLVLLDKVYQFFGSNKNDNYIRIDGNLSPSYPKDFRSLRLSLDDVVSSRDVDLLLLQKKIEKASDVFEKFKLQRKMDKLIKGRRLVDRIFSRALRKLGRMGHQMENLHLPLNMGMMTCYTSVVDYFHTHCFDISKNVYALSRLYIFANLCIEKVRAEDIIKALSKECSKKHRSKKRNKIMLYKNENFGRRNMTIY